MVKQKNKNIIAVLIIIIFVVLGSLIPRYIMLSISDSLNYNVFFLRKTPTKLAKNTYIVSKINSPDSKTKKPVLITKKIACMYNDFLKCETNGCYCNNIFLCKAKKYSKKGDILTPFLYNGLIPKNKYFVVGEHVDSYDSRYFGLVGENEVIRIAIPIF